MDVKRVPQLEVRSVEGPKKLFPEIQLWDTTNNEMLDCWLLKGPEDAKRFEKEISEIFGTGGESDGKIRTNVYK